MWTFPIISEITARKIYSPWISSAMAMAMSIYRTLCVLVLLQKFVQNTQVWTLFTLNTYFERAMCISNINMMQKLVQWSSYFDVAEALHINIRVQWSNNIMYECNEAKDIRVQWSKRYTSAMKQKNIILYIRVQWSNNNVAEALSTHLKGGTYVSKKLTGRSMPRLAK